MSQLTDFTTLLDVDGQLWSLTGNVFKAINEFNEVQGPKIVITDFKGAITGIEAINAGKQYAEAIIEKKLRDNGDLEGASQLLTIASNKCVSATSVYYAAVPVEIYAEYWERANQQNDHCLIIPIWSLLLADKKASKDLVSAIIFQHAEYIDMLISVGKKPVYTARVSNEVETEDELHRVLMHLNSELNQFESSEGLKVDSITWYDWRANIDSKSYDSQFSELTSRKVVSPERTEVLVEEAFIESSILAFLSRASVFHAVKGHPNNYLYGIEKSLPWLAGALVAISVAAGMVGLNWQKSVNDYQMASATLLKESQFDSTFAALKGEMDSVTQLNNQVDKQAGFISELYDVASVKSIPLILSDLKASLSPDIKVTKVSWSDKDGQQGIVIDGYINQGLNVASVIIQKLIVRLSEKGYQVEDNGFVTQKNTNGFQLLLIPAAE